MQFSIKQLGLLIGWLALLLGLMALVKIESQREQWTSQVPAGVLLVANMGLSLYAVLTAVNSTQPSRSFWIGTSIVAVSLTVLQILEIRPPGIGLNAALLIDSVFNSDKPQGQMYTAGHVTQLEFIVVYGWTPILACWGGWLSRRQFQKRQLEEAQS